MDLLFGLSVYTAIMVTLIFRMIFIEVKRVNQPESGTEWVPPQKQKSTVIENNL